MSIEFNADEIFEMAVQIERNGGRFYRLAAKYEENPDARRLMLELAARENAHEKIFVSMREELSASEKVSKTFDPHGEAASYLRALANGRVFDLTLDPTDFFNHPQSLEDILRKAIDLEKDSIVFYLGMREMVPQKLGQNQIDHIIKEEMRHIATLDKELAARRGPPASQKE
ncbi:MAG: rubrerythrin [Proteobacteria bacterium]|nr:rubrerythrin [Pseudomonadota bacterium]NIS67858.1 rubrerythrin [Pseudomonadota bacterium]